MQNLKRMGCIKTQGPSMWCSLCCLQSMAMRESWTTSTRSRETAGGCMSIRPSSRSTFAALNSPPALPTCHTRLNGCTLVRLGRGVATNQCWSRSPASRETLRSVRSGPVQCSSLKRRWRSRWRKRRPSQVCWCARLLLGMTGLLVWVKEGQTTESAIALTQGTKQWGKFSHLNSCNWNRLSQYGWVGALCEAFCRGQDCDNALCHPCQLNKGGCQEDSCFMAGYRVKHRLPNNIFQLWPSISFPFPAQTWARCYPESSRRVKFIVICGVLHFLWSEMSYFIVTCSVFLFFAQVWPRLVLKPWPLHWSEKEVVLEQVNDHATITSRIALT